jgi:hypothetical protein
MLAVVVAALLMTLVVRMHPQPGRVRILDPEGYEVTWSDGPLSRLLDGALMPSLNVGERFAFGSLRRVKWTDGTRTS